MFSLDHPDTPGGMENPLRRTFRRNGFSGRQAYCPRPGFSAVFRYAFNMRAQQKTTPEGGFLFKLLLQFRRSPASRTADAA
jgi:hypothetical protein